MADEKSPPKCPKLMYRIWTDWRRGKIWVDCKRWNCERCLKTRIEEAVQRVLECIPPSPIHDVTVGQKWSEAVRKSYRRRSLPYFGASLQTGGLYVISTHPGKGQAWRTAENDWEEFMTELPNRLITMGIVRWDSSTAWRAEKSTEEPIGSYLWTGLIPGNDPKLLRKAVGEAGFSEDGYGPPSDPDHAIQVLNQILRPDASDVPTLNGKKTTLRELSKWKTITKGS
ncbi:hypothetical protein O7628_11260 [Micromonospora sp. WMMD956]|uniref:hypothetical protein n=1 Tax=Micromonospora sp. WMMD956 TaxID=3016108 RepID=UPI002417B2B4|nr:hypothetical protein [Micromonospora sp. WMMD956]MDG4816080.1 hypothetical protein [Micromonospora sp. WMMD956]